MKITDELYKNKWSTPKFKPIVENYSIAKAYDVTWEPDSTVQLASYSEAMGNHFKEGLNILDYGCRTARYCDFLSKYLEDFTYYGLEIKGSDGEQYMNMANDIIGHDKRVKFGLIDSDLEKEALRKCNVILLGSVFTHLPIEYFYSINKKFKPLINKNGIIIFTCFIKDEYECVGNPNAYDAKDCYPLVYYTYDQIYEYEYKNKVNISFVDTFLAQRTYTHYICKINKKIRTKKK